ncbi:MAG: universal stress protein [Methanobacteriaceae archaeon]|nr:universal stress protein [Methanobacteriaceae archaeon]
MHILIPIKDKEKSIKNIKEILEKITITQITLVTVTTIPTLEFLPQQIIKKDYENQLKNYGQDILNHTKKELEKIYPNIKINQISKIGNSGEEIEKIIKNDKSIDHVILVKSNGNTLDHLVTGDTIKHVIKNTNVPITILPNKD